MSQYPDSFRVNCDKQNVDKSTKNLGTVFLGDSQAEGVGLNFEDTFFGIIENKYNSLVFTNLSSSGYSFSIYFAKPISPLLLKIYNFSISKPKKCKLLIIDGRLINEFGKSFKNAFFSAVNAKKSSL